MCQPALPVHTTRAATNMLCCGAHARSRSCGQAALHEHVPLRRRRKRECNARVAAPGPCTGLARRPLRHLPPQGLPPRRAWRTAAAAAARLPGTVQRACFRCHAPPGGALQAATLQGGPARPVRPGAGAGWRSGPGVRGRARALDFLPGRWAPSRCHCLEHLHCDAAGPVSVCASSYARGRLCWNRGRLPQQGQTYMGGPFAGDQLLGSKPKLWMERWHHTVLQYGFALLCFR